MASNRDDFSPAVKQALAGRAGHKCSFPDCHKSTSGPSRDSLEKSIQNGIAAHISSASPGQGAKRYDPTLTPEQRSSIENGIWMCPTHGNLIDKEYTAYSTEEIKQWKAAAEQAARIGLEQNIPNSLEVFSAKDLAVLKAYCDVLTYPIIIRLREEPFGAIIPYDLVSAVNFILDVNDNPKYSFQNLNLESLRTKLFKEARDLMTHFAKQSAGTPTYYEYIDLNEIRRRDPKNEEYWKQEIYKCRQLAETLSRTAMQILQIKEDAIT